MKSIAISKQNNPNLAQEKRGTEGSTASEVMEEKPKKSCYLEVFVAD